MSERERKAEKKGQTRNDISWKKEKRGVHSESNNVKRKCEMK
jgi:hypothetical protein